MLLGLSQQEVKDWNNSIHAYEKAKRTKRPFGKAAPAVQRRSTLDVIEKGLRFNPVLQSFREVREQSRMIEQQQVQRANEQMKYLRNNYKHATDYDIITLAHSEVLPLPVRSNSLAPQVRKKDYRDPLYQGYNIINGKQYDGGYLRKVALREQKHQDRNIHPEQPRNYNIINGRYAENHDQKEQAEMERTNRESLEKSQELRVYDSVYGRYYNPYMEQQYQTLRKEQEKQHSMNTPKLPPSYLNRQSYVQSDLTVPSETVRESDRKAELSKQRYKMRQMVEGQHRARGEYLSEKKDVEARNRKTKEFDIINSQRYLDDRTQQIFGKEINTSPYQIRPLQGKIKSKAFEQFLQ